MLIRRIARPLLATWFISQGADAVRGPAVHVAYTRPALDQVLARAHVEKLPSDTQLRTIVQAHGAVTALAGLALAFGKAPRTAALILAALTLPVAVANLPVLKLHKAAAPEVRRERRDRLVRSIAFTGAALIAGVDYEGRPGVSWRVSHARAEAAEAAAKKAAHPHR